jgi:ornithine carbamoyltransferase
MTLWEFWGSFDGRKLAYIGDGNNMLNSLLLILPALGVSVSCASPKGYEVTDEIKEKAKARARLGAKVEFFNDPALAAKDADVLYTDVWTSMGFESETKKREEAFAGFQINSELYAGASVGAGIMHCMPMERGKEISADMVEHKNSIIYQQAENRLHVQKALLLSFLTESRFVP